MGDRSLNYSEYAAGGAGTSRIVLTDRSDMNIVKLSVIAPVLVVLVIIIILMLPIAAETKYFGLLLFVVTFGLGGLAFPLMMYEAFSKAAYRVTTEYIEEEYGIISRKLRRIPITYVRDVTYEQNLIQAMYGLSTITVAATNGDRIKLEHVRDGKHKRELIWNLVLSKTPGAHREA